MIFLAKTDLKVKGLVLAFVHPPTPQIRVTSSPAVSPRTGSRALWQRGTHPRAAGLPPLSCQTRPDCP